MRLKIFSQVASRVKDLVFDVDVVNKIQIYNKTDIHYNLQNTITLIKNKNVHTEEYVNKILNAGKIFLFFIFKKHLLKFNFFMLFKISILKNQIKKEMII